MFNGDKELTGIQKQNVIDWYESVVFTNKGNQDRREMFERLLEISKRKTPLSV